MSLYNTDFTPTSLPLSVPRYTTPSENFPPVSTYSPTPPNISEPGSTYGSDSLDTTRVIFSQTQPVRRPTKDLPTNNLPAVRKIDSSDKVKPYQSAELVISLVFIVLLLLFLAYIIFLVVNSPVTSPQNPVRTDLTREGVNFFTCPAGSCGTDIRTGAKTCPVTDDEPVVINPAYQVCNSRFFCDNPLTPYAELADGSTTFTGACPENVACNCLPTAQCANYIRSFFTTADGNPYTVLTNQRINFPQSNSFIDANNQESTNAPLKLKSPGTQFCTVPYSWLAFAGCNFIAANNVEIPRYADLLACMGLPRACNQGVGSPCLDGTLALITDNVDDLNQTNFYTKGNFGCVSGTPCACNEVAIFDTNFQAIVCRALPE